VNSGRTAATCGLCAAKSTAIRCANSPRRFALRTTVSTYFGAPETTTERGPLIAAMPTIARSGSTRLAASSGAASTTAIAPWPSSRANIPLRRTMTRAASDKDNAPLTAAAATSPRLWPRTASGVTPHDANSFAIPTWKANIAGCTSSVAAVPLLAVGEPSANPLRGVQIRGPPASAIASAAAVTDEANTG
jgi:hypothetical protein